MIEIRTGFSPRFSNEADRRTAQAFEVAGSWRFHLGRVRAPFFAYKNKN
jgi:hypothetical protein